MLEEFLTNKTKQHIVRVVLMLFMLIFMVWPIYKFTSADGVICEKISLDAGWDIKVHGNSYGDVKLSSFYFDMCSRGDNMVMETVLPGDSIIDKPVLDFYSVHSVVDIYLDGKLLYTYGHELYDEHQLLGYGDHFISLPEDYAGKKLRIELYVTEDNAFDGLQELTISQSVYFMQETLSGMRVNLLVSMFLILFGVITMILSLCMIRRNTNFMQTFCIAMCAFLMGCWTLCNNDLIMFFISDLRVKVYIEYMTFYLLPVPFTYYFREMVDEENTPIALKIYFWTLIGVELAYVITSYVSQYLNIAHFPQFLTGCHAIMAFALIFIICLNFKDIKNYRKQKKKNSIMIGFGFAVLAVAFELFRFNFSKYMFGFKENKYSSTLSFAVLIIIIALLVDYGQGVSRNLLKDAKQRVLEQLAYMDELTGLCNRRKCEDTLHEYMEKKIAYAVLSLDMNLLKKVNDTEGHDRGDAMLKKFADTLMEVFRLHGTVGRMGGDEFIVIMPEISEREAKELVDEMISTMEEKNSQDRIITLSTAYGLAMSEEVGKDADAHAAYRLADDRMYENKRQSKMGRR